MSPALLAPGHALFPAGGRWIVRTPDGAMAAIRADRSPDVVGLIGGPPGPATVELRRDLQASGILTAATPPAAPPSVDPASEPPVRRTSEPSADRAGGAPVDQASGSPVEQASRRVPGGRHPDHIPTTTDPATTSPATTSPAFTAGPPSADGGPSTTAVLLIGPDQVTAPLRDELIAGGVEGVTVAPTGRAAELLERIAADGARVRLAAVSWCAATPADLPAAVADDLDRRCMHDGTLWQRTVLEGGTAVVEPLGAGSAPVTHAMTRHRRLAAAGHPDALSGFWSDQALHGPPLLTAASAALVARRLATDLAAALARPTAATPATRRLSRLDLQTGRWTHHPILPVPRHDSRA